MSRYAAELVILEGWLTGGGATSVRSCADGRRRAVLLLISVCRAGARRAASRALISSSTKRRWSHGLPVLPASNCAPLCALSVRIVQPGASGHVARDAQATRLERPLLHLRRQLQCGGGR